MAIKVQIVENDEYEFSEREEILFLWIRRFVISVTLVGVAIGAASGLHEAKDTAIHFRILIALFTSLLCGGVLFLISSFISAIFNFIYFLAPLLKIFILVFSIGCALYFGVTAFY